MKIPVLILVLSHVPILLNMVFGFIIYNKTQNALRIFIYYLFITGTLQMLSLVLALNGKNNMPVLHIYVLSGFLTISAFYATVLSDFIKRRTINYFTGCFVLFTVCNSVFIQNLFTFNSYALTLESVLIIIYAVSTFLLLLNDVVKNKLQTFRLSINYINSGLFIYYSSTLIIFYFGRAISLQFSIRFNQYVWILHDLFSVFMQICFFIALWKRPKV